MESNIFSAPNGAAIFRLKPDGSAALKQQRDSHSDWQLKCNQPSEMNIIKQTNAAPEADQSGIDNAKACTPLFISLHVFAGHIVT